MKQVKMRKDDYDDLVYPGIALARNTTETDLRTQNFVLLKLEAEGHSIPAERMQPVLCDRCQTLMMHEPKKRPPALYEMNGLIAEFLFEDPEAAYMVEKLTNHLPNVAGNLARRLIPILDALQKEISEMDMIGIVARARIEGEGDEEEITA